jgi:eukaryotic-like serine/threonine-protein kinase
MPGTEKKIGPYNVLTEIGSGGMAVVHKAEQPALGRLVAIKELRSELAVEPSLIQRFEREARTVAQLAHQNIVHIYDYLTRGSSMFIVMEFVEGVDLYELLTKVERLPPDIAAIIALQAARALEYAHFRGVVHRDFKPSNLMITKQGEVKLMDFGIARDETNDDLTRPGTALGTPAYMSPEQIMGEKVDFRSDIFSFGIVLYQMLTGQKPFIEDDTKSVMQRILNEPYTPPKKIFPDIPWGLSRIMKRCLEKKPGARYKRTEDLRKELESFVASKVSINYNGRLVIYLRHRQMISDTEAKTFVRDDELDLAGTLATDTGYIDSNSAVLRPLLAFNSLILLVLIGWTSLVSALKLGSEVGYVKIHAQPWAEVYVEGKLHDVTPFMAPLSLAPGQYTIEFRNAYFEPESRSVEVLAGETRKVNVTLTRRRKK